MKTRTSVMRLWMVVCLVLLTAAVAETKAQCVAHPDRETAVGVMNARITRSLSTLMEWIGAACCRVNAVSTL